jgi:predicted nucleic acid-binding protein
VPLYFLDTSALVYRYADGSPSRRVRRVTSDKRAEVYIANITIVEMASALAKVCRTSGHSTRKFEGMDGAFLKDVATGKLNIRDVTQGDMQRARHLLRYAGVVRKRNLGSADALVAISCLELALEKKVPVVFYTEDWTLYSTIREINSFRSVLELRCLAATRGGIPSTTKRGR